MIIKVSSVFKTYDQSQYYRVFFVHIYLYR